MSLISVTGAIYGDEGKAKVSDVISKKAKAVVKFQGGSNAGNTAVVNGKKYVLHMMPVGALRNLRSLIAAGVVLNPEKISEELALFNDNVNLGIDPRTHLVLPYHIALDIAMDAGKNVIGTTKQGIGPAYQSSRKEPRFFDLVQCDKDLEEKIRYNYKIYDKILKEVYNYPGIFVPEGGNYGAKFVKLSENDVVTMAMDSGKKLKQYMIDVAKEIRRMIRLNQNVLFQGSQGVNLDKRFGNYPKITCSQPIPASIASNVGIPPLTFDENIGVVKAYISKVGQGPVVTCLDGNVFPVDENLSEDIAKEIRKDGAEFGATTGRPRRVGWLDLVQLRDRCELCGYTQLALTKLDTLGDKGDLKLCIAYEINGKIISEYEDYDLKKLYNTNPVYLPMEGFSKKEVLNAKTFEDLPKAAQKYIKKIEENVNVPITFISTGPEREKKIYRKFKGF